MSRDDRDSLSSDGAHHLAARIREYWRAQGYVEPYVHVEAIPNRSKDGYSVYTIRSDMLDGLPRSSSTNGTGRTTILPGKLRLRK